MSHDTLLHRLVRPAARGLAGTGVRPNHLTGLRIATAAAAATAFALGSGTAVRAGAVLFVLSALLDRADGELARWTSQFSRWGHRMDLVADCCADAAAFLAMGIGARHGWLRGWAIGLGVLAAAGTVQLFRQLSPAVAGSPPRRPFDPDDLILLVPLLACAAGVPAVLLLAGSISPLAACWLSFVSRASGPAATATGRPAFAPRHGRAR